MARKRAAPAQPERSPKKPAALLPKGYEELLGEIKERIRSAQLRAGLAVNRELVLLYWQIGRDILARQEHEGWGTKVIDRLAADLRRAYPGHDRAFAAQPQIHAGFRRSLARGANCAAGLLHKFPGSTTVVLLDKVKDRDERQWYIRKTIENGWSRNVLVHWIESDLYQRQGKATTNFGKTLPPPAIRPGPGNAERPVQLRVPHARRATPRNAPCRKGCWSTSSSS